MTIVTLENGQQMEEIYIGETKVLHPVSNNINTEKKQTLDEQITQLKNDNLILMDALATTFEEILALEEKFNALGGMV